MCSYLDILSSLRDIGVYVYTLDASTWSWSCEAVTGADCSTVLRGSTALEIPLCFGKNELKYPGMNMNIIMYNFM